MAIFGGTAPLLTTLLIKLTGDNQAPGLYLIGASLLILLVLARLPETYRADMDGAALGSRAPWVPAWRRRDSRRTLDR